MTEIVPIPLAAAVVCGAIVAAVVIAVILWAPLTPARMLALALASAAAAGGVVSVVTTTDRRKGGTPTAVPAVPSPSPDMRAPGCSPTEEHSRGPVLAAPDEALREALLQEESRRFGGG